MAYRIHIIVHILSEETMRFGELQRAIPPVSQKMLTQQLRELEADGVVQRELYPGKPPRTEYSLTARGQTLRPILQALYAWGGEGLAPSAGIDVTQARPACAVQQ